MARLGNILYRLCRAVAIITCLVGAWWAYWAPDNRLIVFTLFGGPALLLWSVGKFFRFVLTQR